MNAGAAPATATMDIPILYSFRRCPYAMRARLALAVSGLKYELREVVLREKPAEMLAVSPKATVPVLVLPNGQVIDESLDIMQWALAQNDPEKWLAASRASMADMQALIAVNDGSFKQALDRYKYPNHYPLESCADTSGFAHAHRALAARCLSELEPLLTDGCLLGATASLADMAILPFVRQFAHTDAAWFAAQPWPQLQAWLARFEAGAWYQSVMGKHQPWKAKAV